MVAEPFVLLCIVPELFAGDDSFAGANFSAASAVDAGVGIDFVDVAFRD